jgi:DNA-binding beta-propeller fold protein YncE
MAPPAGTACTAVTTSPLQACTLAAWPAFPVAVAPDLSAAAHVSNTPLAASPFGILISPDGGFVFVAVQTSPGRLGVLQRSGATAPNGFHIDFDAGEIPYGMALSRDGTTLAVALTDSVALMDVGATESDSASAMIGTVPTGGTQNPIDVAFSADGSTLFVALEYDREVGVVDVASQTLTGSIPIAGDAVTGVAVSPDGTRLYVTTEEANEFIAANPMPATDQDVGSLTIVDAIAAQTNPAGSILGRVFVGRAPVRTVLSPDGTTAYTTLRGSNAVVALDTTKLLTQPSCALLSLTAVGASPVGLSLIHGGAGLMVANSDRFAMPVPNGTVMLLATAPTLTLVGQIGVGMFPREMDADATALFLSDFDSKELSGIDLTTLSP